jgi:hypothetical protein
LEGGPPGFPRDFSSLVVLRNHAQKPFAFQARGFHPLWRHFPVAYPIRLVCNFWNRFRPTHTWSYNPEEATPGSLTFPRFGLFPFRSPLLGESRLISFMRVTKMFQFTHLPSRTLCIQMRMTGHDPCRVASFGNPGISGCSLLPRAYRSLPRPSSSLGAKASTIRS